MTTKTTHTPGQWHMSGEYRDPPSLTLAPDRAVWDVTHTPSDRRLPNVVIAKIYNNEANARLIAAGPELYVNLSGLLAWLDSAKRQDAEAWKWLPDEAYLASARAALAQAQGEK